MRKYAIWFVLCIGLVFYSRGAIASISESDRIQEAYEALEYTFEDPFVLQNPYNNSPLTAIIKFPTEQDAIITLTIKGKGNAPDLIHTFKTPKKEHEIPIVGLYANYKNELILKAHFADGTRQEKKLLIETPKVNKRAFYFIKNKTQPLENRYYFLLEGIVFDEFGEIRFDFETDKMLYWMDGELIEESRNNGLVRYSLIGKKLQTYVYPEGFVSFSHGIGQKPNGNFLVIGSFKNKEAVFKNTIQPTQRDFVIELDYYTGKMVNKWDFSEILNPNRSVIIQSDKTNYGINNWCHMNAVDYDSSDKSIVISCKNMGMAKIDEKTGDLKWVFGPKIGFEKSGRLGKGPALYQKVLTAVNKKGDSYPEEVQKGFKAAADFKWPTKTHHAKVLGNNLFSIFDNSGIIYDANIITSPYSSASIFAIDPKKNTVRQIWRKDLGVHSEVGSSVLYDKEKEEVIVFISQINDPNQKGISYGKIMRYDFNTYEPYFEGIVYRGGNSYFYRVDDFNFYPLKEEKLN